MAADINFYGLLYEFHRTSTNGADILITIEKKWYEGEVKQRALGRAPVIKRENKDHIFGTSCELYAECLVDGEYADMYTSDPYEFRVSVYKDETLLWQGFVSPELYSEPDAAPPYDVQITATDGLGELKNSIYKERGAASILSHIMGLIGQYPIYVISGLRYVDSTGAISQDHDILNVRINLDHEKGNSKYDVLQNLLTSLNANITQLNGRYVIFRETDFINKATDEGVEAFDVNGEKVYISIASFGSMTSHQWWPIGQLSTVVEPAKNSLVLQAPNHYKDNVLDFSQWSVLNSAEYDTTEDAYILPDEGSYITQALDFDNEVGYRLGLRIRARNVGDSEEDQNIGLMIKVNARTYSAPEGRDFWLVKSEVSTGNARTDYLWRGQEDYFEEALNMPSDADTASDAQNVDIVIPLYDHSQNGLSYIFASSLSIKIFNPAGIHDIYVYDVSLVKYEQSEGYEAKVVINNAAREAESDIDLSMSSASFAPAAGNMFMTGLPMQADGLLIEQWQIPGSAAQEYLSAMSYDYARAVALPKMKYSGVLNVPDTATILPILFLRDGTYYFPKTYTYDLYNDEIQVELISISAADVSLSSVVISQYAESSGNMGGVTTGGGGGGSVISLPRDKVMSDTSDNAVENRVIKAYVDSEVKDLADLLTSMWRIEDDKIVTDMDVLVKANLIVSGDTSSGGEGQDTPAEGTVTGIEVNGTPYEPNTQGVIDLSAAFNAIDVSDQLKDVVDALEEAIGKKADKATTLAEYGITDANISNGVITLGANTITPLTSHQTIYSLRLNNSAGEQIVKFEPNVKSSEINLTKAMVGLDLVENTKLSTWAGTNNITTLGTITSGTWQGSRVSKSYLDADLVAWFDKVSPLLVKDSSGNIKVSTNLIVTGDTSSGGSGSDTPASGTVTGIKVNGVTYEPTAGIVTIPDYPTSLTWSAISGKPSFATVATSGKYSDLSGLPTIPTVPTKVSAFTNDIGYITGITKNMVDSVLGGTTSSNANKFLMCTGSTTVWGAVTKKMVASALGASTGGRYLIDTGGDVSWANVPTSLPASDVYAWAKKPSLALADVPDLSSKYLPLAGGAIGSGLSNSFPLLISSTNAYTGLAFYTSGGTGYMRFQGGSTWGVTDAGWNNSYTLIHSGNIGNYAIKTSGDSTKLGIITLQGGYLKFNLSNGTFLGAYNISSTTGAPIFLTQDEQWKTIAFTDSNVASATYASNAKVLVDAQGGKSVAYVSGNTFYIGDSIYPTISTHILGNYVRLRYGANASTGLMLNANGNVTIGATDLASTTTKLYVDGGIRFAPRTIWGQSFDGTGNVSGNLSLGNNGIFGGASSVNMLYYDTSNTLYLGYGMSGVGGSVICGNAIAMRYGASRDMGFILNSSGNVTIGGSDLAGTSVKLYVDGNVDVGKHEISNAKGIYCYDSGTGYYVGGRNYGAGKTDGGLLLYSYGATPMSFYTNLSERMHITAGGNVGIGTTSPAHKLDVVGNARFGHESVCDIYFKRTSGYNYLHAAHSFALTVGNSTSNIAFSLESNKSAKFYGAVTMSSSLSVTGGSYCYGDAFFGAGKEGIYISSSGQSIAWHNTSNTYVKMMMSFASSSVLVYQELRPNANNSLTLGTSSYQWSHLYAVGATFSGDVTINGNLIVKGDTSSGGAGQSTGVNGPVNIRVDALFNMGSAQNVTQATMDSYGLTMTVVNNILSGLYTKVVDISGTYNDVWSYDGFESTTYINIFIRQGDGFDIHNGVSLRYNKSTATWNVSIGEI